MKPSKFSLQINPALSNAPLDFVFIAGLGRYQCSKVVASAACQSVRNLLLCDPTVSFMRIRTAELSQPFFSQVIEHIKGNPIEISEGNIEYLRQVGVELQCNTLIQLVSTYIQSMFEKNINICLNNLFNKSELYNHGPGLYLQTYQHEMKFIAKHFGNFIRNQEMLNLPVDVLDIILMDPDLDQHVNDSDIFAFVLAAVKAKEFQEIQENQRDAQRDAQGGNKREDKDKSEKGKYLSLFSHINFDQVESSEAQTFFNLIKGKEVSGALWLAMTLRLKCNVSCNE